MGAVIGGQVLPETPDEEEFRRVAREIGVNEDEYIAALKKVNVRTEEAIVASATLLGQVLNNYINTEYTEKYNGKMIARLTEGVNQCEAMVKDIRVYTDKFNSIQQRQGILSLNARIEAARAGSAGRGFAVVAQEVENLSKDSKELNQMISEKVDSISKVVHEMTETDQNIFL